MPDIETQDPTDQPIEIRAYRPGDEAEILAVWHRVFTWARRSMDEWNWEFRDNPEGVHVYLGLTPTGRVVSQFTGIPRRMKVGHEIRQFAEIVDSLSDPDFRAGLKKLGLFATTVHKYVEHYGNTDHETVMYGLPTQEAFRLGQKLCGYVHIDHLESVVVPSRATWPTLDGTTVERWTSFGRESDELWERVAPQHDVAVVKDSRYLAWRYSKRPGVTYRNAVLRDARGVVFALLIVKDRWLEAERQRHQTAAAEWIVDRRHPQSELAFEALAALAGEDGAERGVVLFRRDNPDWCTALSKGFLTDPINFRFVARTYDSDSVPISRLAAGWDLALGDFDVI